MKIIRQIVGAAFVLFTFFGHAGTETFSNRIEGASIVGGSFDTYDDKYIEMSTNPYWMSDFTNFRVQNYVRLGINPKVIQSTSADNVGTVEVEITYHTWDAFNGIFVINVVTKTLSTQYFIDRFDAIEDQSTFVFQDAHFVSVRVNSVSSGLDEDMLFLESGIQVERYYTMLSPSIVGIADRPIPAGYSYDQSQNEFIEVNWPYHYGAESYELEWVHVNDYNVTYDINGQPIAGTIASSQLNYDYYLNSTRVEVWNNVYRIPNIFDRGYFIYRIRPIGRGGVNFDERVEGSWSASAVGTIDGHPSGNTIYIDREYDQGMNWSHSVAYAEDGKRMESISFVDGLGRGRQSVSRNTVTEQVIVNNVYYDELGRGVISDLPTPQDEDFPRHYPDFNLADGTTTAYQEDVFDIVNSGGGICDLDSKGMSETSGAAEYYSPSNTNQDGANAMIPDAENFPFTRVTYRDDFTGRVDRMASAGGTLKMGSERETRIIYVSASQEELNQLFGVEAGWQSHYQKMVTLDPNGQVYVQYTDMAGRVVATYMQGEAPENLIALDDASGTQMYTHNLIVNGMVQNTQSNPTIAVFTYTQFFPEQSADYDIDYSLTPEEFENACMSESACFDCVYDLTISLVEECGAVITIPNSTVQINGGALNAMCEGTGIFTLSETVTIPKGTYTLTKTLSVNQEVIADYWCLYLENQDPAEECIPSIDDFFNAAYENETFPECDAQAADLVVTPNDCELREIMMLGDVSPGGQYGLFTIDVYGDYLPGDATCVLYSDGVGYTFSPLAGGTFTPTTLEELILNWEEDWAQDMLQFHPEYCFIESGGYCDDMSASYAYDEAMLATDNFADACAAGYLLPLGYAPSSTSYFSGCATSPVDPFFGTVSSPGPGYAYTTAMQDNLNSVVVISGTPFDAWKYFMAMIINPNATTVSQINAAYSAYLSMNSGEDAYHCDDDLLWSYFRSSYLKWKGYYYQQLQDDYAALCTGLPDIGLSTGGDYADKIPAFPSEAYVLVYVNAISAANGGGTITDISDQSQMVPAVQAMTASGCEDACEDYADQWLQQLSSCQLSGTYINDLSTGTLSAIRQDLIDMCMTGCGESPPMPVSVPVSGSSEPTIEAILISYGFTESTTCTEWLIAEPGPYDQYQNAIDNSSSPLDTCACEAVLQAQEDLAGYPSGTTIEEVLAINTGVTLDDADHLVCECEHIIGESEPWYPGYVWQSLQQPILNSSPFTVPEALGCSQCYDCASVEAQLDDLTEHFGFDSGTTQENLEAFLLQQNAQTILANYLNNAFSYKLTATAYLNFIAGCQSDETNPYCTINPLALQFVEVLELLAYRGQLIAPSTVNLNDESIVYANSQLQSNGINQYYSSSISGDVMTTTFYDGVSTSCTATITLPSGADFGFEDIISFSGVYADSYDCSGNNTFKAQVQYLDCGEPSSAIVTIYTACFEANVCQCGSDALLCADEASDTWHPCYQPQLDQMYQVALEALELSLEDLYLEFQADYNAQCAAAFASENLSYSGPDRYYQYTLYYYDQSGNLVRTVAPEGINLLAQSNNTAINAARLNPGTTTPISGTTIPVHNFKTEYKYNTYNQLIETTNPDQDGETKFWYDYYGRIVASQNPVQANDDLYSYTFYDDQGRPEQVGQVVKTTTPDTGQDDLGAAFVAWVVAGTRTEITKTRYDRTVSSGVEALFSNGEQENLRLRVASVYYHPTYNIGIQSWLGYESAIHYSYDIHGNVKEVIQDVPALLPVEQDIKSTQYEYELISGNVEKVKFQDGELDEMSHSYIYDKMNRLTEVFTSTDDVHSTREVHYRYFDYGPLARVELGKDKVQGMDYAYTINGWMKAMNGGRMNPDLDMGMDGTSGYLTANTDVHTLFAPDVLAYNLGYFENDYAAISAFQVEADYALTDFETASPGLYNGNIRHVVSDIFGMDRMGAAYRYDQLNRLKSMTAFFNTNSAYDWQSIAASQDYASSYTYDRNGNLQNLTRKAYGANRSMDNMDYQYYTLGANPSNRLSHVVENQTVNTWGGDITPMSSNNYDYDELGQLLIDPSEGIQNMIWRKGDKKLKKIERDNVNGADVPDVEFIYNPFGIRVVKIEKPRTAGVPSSPDEWNYTYYAYDANGQCMATYDVTMSTGQNEAILAEQHIYGASRIGMLKQNELIYDDGPITPSTSDIISNWAGERRYEINNYLGNVNAVLIDRKIPTSTGVPTLFEAVVVHATDYYPFGMAMPGRDLPFDPDGEDYRYAYNGMEQDNEVSGNGNSYTTEFRQYDPRLGRWKSLDPLMAKFPWMSPYVAFNDNPMFYVDPNGLEGQDWVKGEKTGGQWHWDARVVNEETAIKFYGADAEYAAPGHVYQSNEGTDYTYSVRLGENGSWKTNISQYDEVSATGQSSASASLGNPFQKSNGLNTTLSNSKGGGLDYYFWEFVDWTSAGTLDADKMPAEWKRILTPLPDAISMDLEGDVVVVGGAEYTLHATYILKGEHASIYPTYTLETTQSFGINVGVSAGVSGMTKLRGSLSPEDLVTTSKPFNSVASGSPTYNGSFGLNALGRVTINGSLTMIQDANGNNANAIITTGAQFGLTPLPPGVPTVSGGRSNTQILLNLNPN